MDDEKLVSEIESILTLEYECVSIKDHIVSAGFCAYRFAEKKEKIKMNAGMRL